MSVSKLYRIKFVQLHQLYELHAHKVSHGAMMGFLEVEELVFPEKSSIIADPTDERLRIEFANVKRIYVPLQAVIRVDEVSALTPGKIADIDGGSNILRFPGTPVANA